MLMTIAVYNFQNTISVKHLICNLSFKGSNQTVPFGAQIALDSMCSYSETISQHMRYGQWKGEDGKQ